MKKEIFIGSMGLLVFWILVFWPIAIWYYYDQKKQVELRVLPSMKKKTNSMLTILKIIGVIILVGVVLGMAAS